MKIEDKYAETISIVFTTTILEESCLQLPIDHGIKKHITLAILGQIPEVTFSQTELVSVLKDVRWEDIHDIQVQGLALFGPNSDFLVAKLSSKSIKHSQQLLMGVLEKNGIMTVDQYHKFSPHITLAHEYQGSLPEYSPFLGVEIGPPTLWWGKESIQLI